MEVRAKFAALLTLTGLAGGALGQEAPPPLLSYTELSTELIPSLSSPSAGLRVEAVRWAAVGADGAFGLALGMVPVQGMNGGAARPSAGIGFRWRSHFGERQRLDVATWRHLPAADDDDAGVPVAPLTTRIEMQFIPPKNRGLGMESGAIGLQLSSDTKLQLKIRRGGPMLYYRSRF
jgi:hypothetical protein